ncbi:MAG TPA: ComEC/Rec2 family competence protein, partial [Nannocystaceae bacterium]|nr:ComEC/Rec2 family competence protein [Nannocystaceae bacterium]
AGVARCGNCPRARPPRPTDRVGTMGCNKTGVAVDRQEVHATLLWIGTLTALGGAFAWVAQTSLGAQEIATGIVVLVGAVAIAAASSLWMLRSRGRAFGAVLVAAVALAAVRGGADALRLREAQMLGPRGKLGQLSTPGAGLELRRFEVIGASWPGSRCRALVREVSGDSRGEARMWLAAPPEVCPLAHGSEISVLSTALEVRAGPRWPEDDDARRAAWARGAELAVEVDALWPSTPPEATLVGAFHAWIAALRQREWTRTRGDEAAAFVSSSLFGLRVAMSPEERERLAVAGLGHLVAVSGMQVSLVAFAIYRLLARGLAGLGGSPAWAAIGAAVPVVAYVVLCGAEAPAVRAAIMVAAVGLASWSGRPTHGLCTLAWTAVAMLAVRPAWAVDAGFQLSVVAMAALVSAPAQAGLVLQSWRVAWAVAPVVAVQFGNTGAWAVVTNLVAVPVFTIWIVPLGVVGVVLAPFVGAWAHEPAKWGAELVLDVARVVAGWPRVTIGMVALVGIAAIVGRGLARSEVVRRWLPSGIACWGAIAAWGITSTSSTSTSTSAADWLAWGGRRHHAVLVAALDREGVACLRDPVGVAGQFPALVRGLGFAGVGVVEPVGAPHVVEVVERLEIEGLLAEGGECRCPAAGAVRRAMASCVARFGAPVLARVQGRQVACFVGGSWSAAVSYDEAP